MKKILEILRLRFQQGSSGQRNRAGGVLCAVYGARLSAPIRGCAVAVAESSGFCCELKLRIDQAVLVAQLPTRPPQHWQKRMRGSKAETPQSCGEVFAF